MTAQAGEELLYKGEGMSMAAVPLNQYLRDRNDISFVSPSTACWRGYFGQWEIRNNKLYLTGLKAYLEGYEEVGLEYLFPSQNEVFADWFSGEIRIPQGEMLDYVHMGYSSLYERDLMLVIENGVLVKEYYVDNQEEYQERLKKAEQRKAEQQEKELKKKKKDKIFVAICVLVLIGTSAGVYYLIISGTALSYITATLIVIPLFLVLLRVIIMIARKEEDKQEDKAVAFIGINLLVFLFVGICVGIYYLIQWGTILAYVISGVLVVGVLCLAFVAIRNQIKNKKN
jgi:hypothetical protein